jgi:hypothetical protein
LSKMDLRWRSNRLPVRKRCAHPQLGRNGIFRKMFKSSLERRKASMFDIMLRE